MIKDSAAKGKSAYAISKELGISKNTAKKYMEQPVQVHGLKGSHKGSKLGPYKAQLHAVLDKTPMKLSPAFSKRMVCNW